MTRREMREHCFKMLFGVDFYPAEETAKQVEQYFGSPDEDDTTADGTLRSFTRWRWQTRTESS